MADDKAFLPPVVIDATLDLCTFAAIARSLPSPTAEPERIVILAQMLATVPAGPTQSPTRAPYSP